MISEGWQGISFVTRLCDSPPFAAASGDLLLDYCFFISRWRHRSGFGLRIRWVFSVHLFQFWLPYWDRLGILTFGMCCMPFFTVCVLSWLCMQKSTNALLRNVCKSVVVGEQCDKHDIPIATVAKLFMLMLSRKLPMI